MEALFSALEASTVAEYLRGARWGYAAVNATHIFGIALLVGAILPLDLRLLGLWPSLPRAALARVLVPLATAGLIIAVCTGALLFSVRATEYTSQGFVQAKIALIALGIGLALVMQWRYGRYFENTAEQRLVGPALLSMGCWLGALVCGRFIAFADT